jgi:hypothetical protein
VRQHRATTASMGPRGSDGRDGSLFKTVLRFLLQIVIRNCLQRFQSELAYTKFEITSLSISLYM